LHLSATTGSSTAATTAAGADSLLRLMMSWLQALKEQA
jgi:hypothetical protein